MCMEVCMCVGYFPGSAEKLQECNTVEPLKTDTPRDKPKFPSYRGVRLTEVSQNFHVTLYMTL